MRRRKPHGLRFEVHATPIDKSRTYQGLDGSSPSEDGRYYLEPIGLASYRAVDLHAQGIVSYCARCSAPLNVKENEVSCSKDPEHFWVWIVDPEQAVQRAMKAP